MARKKITVKKNTVAKDDTGAKEVTIATKDVRCVKDITREGLTFWLEMDNRVVTDGNEYYMYHAYTSLEGQTQYVLEVYNDGIQDPVRYIPYIPWKKSMQDVSLKGWGALYSTSEAEEALIKGYTVSTIYGKKYMARKLKGPSGEDYTIVFETNPHGIFDKLRVLCEIKDFHFVCRDYQFMIHEQPKKK